MWSEVCKKQATAKLLDREPAELMPLSADAGSVSYYWKVSFEFVLHLELQNSISQTLMSLKDSENDSTAVNSVNPVIGI